MRLCTNCNRITAGDPLFCAACGRSFDSKLCPRLHENPRTAEFCSTCGSRDLSTPQPVGTIGMRFMYLLFRVLGGVLLVLASLLLITAFIQTLATNADLQGRLLLLALILGVLWWIYVQLPAVLKRGIHTMVRRNRSSGSKSHGPNRG